ncbi:MAG: hypothetical protein JWN43_2055 [Gammaproteobacteria bacterium]|nr:hypothetical protein [Gammaproteobacteria bacterium]
MQVISFKNTSLFKRGIWISAIALIAFVTAPAVLDGSLRRDPTPSVVALCLLGAFFAYILRRVRFHRLADEVQDCGDYLKVRRGRVEESISFSTVSAADVTTSAGIHRITVRLREPTRLGGQIEFLPQASLWSNLPAVRRLAINLTDRASQARERRVIK